MLTIKISLVSMLTGAPRELLAASLGSLEMDRDGAERLYRELVEDAYRRLEQRRAEDGR